MAFLLKNKYNINTQPSLNRQLTIFQITKINPLIKIDIISKINLLNHSLLNKFLTSMIQIQHQFKFIRGIRAYRNSQDIFISIQGLILVNRVAEWTLNLQELGYHVTFVMLE